MVRPPHDRPVSARYPHSNIFLLLLGNPALLSSFVLYLCVVPRPTISSALRPITCIPFRDADHCPFPTPYVPAPAPSRLPERLRMLPVTLGRAGRRPHLSPTGALTLL